MLRAMSADIVADLTLDEVRRLLEGDGDSDLLDHFERFAGAGLVVGAAVSGTPAPLALLGPKNELVKLGRSLTRRFARDEAPTSADRLRRLEVAHELLVFTAFFEACETVFVAMGVPSEITADDRRWLSSRAETGERAVVVTLPHPADGLARKVAELKGAYERMTRDLTRLLSGLSAWERLEEGPRIRAEKAIQALPQLAADIYCSQLVKLASEVPEYAAWLTVKADSLLLNELEDLGVAAAAMHARIVRSEQELDVGLCRLQEAVDDMPKRARVEQAERVIDGLRRAYHAHVGKPILKQQASDTTDVELSYPSKAEAFIPQSHKVLRVVRTSTPVSLEAELVWAKESLQHNLPEFLLGYLSSPFSAETPMLVLGHPGSGKSLLTELLAARLATPAFNCVRIELRDVDVERDLQRLLERQIELDTGLEINWANFSAHLADTPPVVIFDGFDELLQASGKVHADFLNKVQDFQQREAVQGRPVRAIVTSRITLIDKAVVPAGSVVVRLMAFDDDRQERWATIWNSHNAEYFTSRDVTPFQVPADADVMELAKQPLLLLMLALYDSEDNQLEKQRGLDRTRLYDDLLRRFIRRERNKVESSLPDDQLDELVETDMRRLRAAAIGMYNRRSLYLRTDDIERDIEYLGLLRDVPDASGRLLTQSDLLLGSFFFVHQSDASSGTGTAAGQQRVSTFEFLHNTFGEFLTADFMLAVVLPQITSLMSMMDQQELREQAQLTLNEGTLPKQWFVAFMHAPLYGRPVIVEMLREWCDHLVQDRDVEPSKMAMAAEQLIGAQIAKLVDGGTPPPGLLGDGSRPYPAASLLEHYAVYSLNLVLVWTVVSDVAGVRPTLPAASWEALTSLWRTKLSLEDLSALVPLITTEERDGQVAIGVNVEPDALMSSLDGIRQTARVLQDDILAPLVGLHQYDAWAKGPESLGTLATELEEQGFDDLELPVLLRRVRRLTWQIDEPTRRALEPHIRETCGSLRFGGSNRDLLVLLAHPDAPMALRQLGHAAVEPPSWEELWRTSESYSVAFMRFAINDPISWRTMLSDIDDARWSELARLPLACGFVLRALQSVPSLVLKLDLAALIARGASSEVLASLAAYRELAFEQPTADAAIDVLISRNASVVFSEISPDAMRAIVRTAGWPSRHDGLASWLAEVDEDVVGVPRDVWLSLLALRGGVAKAGGVYRSADPLGELTAPMSASEFGALITFMDATRHSIDRRLDSDHELQMTIEMLDHVPVVALLNLRAVFGDQLRPELREHLEALVKALGER
jgi:hypothetical protein